MPSLLVQGPELGLNGLVPSNMLDPREAAKGTHNIIYENGLLRTAWGFAKFDMATDFATGLNSGDTVLKLFGWDELDGHAHLMAVTNSKIYEHDTNNSTWADKSGASYSSGILSPVSHVAIGHDDTDIYLNDDSAKALAYHHVIVCDGGLTNIQRWAGRFENDFADLVGAGGYHGGTTHRALHIGVFQNRLILLSPKEYDSGSSTWIDHNQAVRYPAIGKIQTWTGTGSGYVNLIDTGGYNVWAAKLGGQYIIYQSRGIWSLDYVGGSTVFSPRPQIPDIGLLAWHLLVSYNNVHYFIGTDYKVYAYYGGTVKEVIGDKVHKYFQEDLDTAYESRCIMAMGPKGKRLWVLIVPNGSLYITRAYVMDMRTRSWTRRDFDNYTTSGVTAVSLVGAQTYSTGQSYSAALERISDYDFADDTATEPGDGTLRFGDVLFDSTANVLDWSTLSAVADYDFSWKTGEIESSAGGLFFCFSYANDPTRLIAGDVTDYSGLMLRIDDGSDSDNMPTGTHFYGLTDVSSTLDAGTDYTVTVYVIPEETTGTGIADLSTDTPVIKNDTTATLYDPSGETYQDVVAEVEVGAQMVIGDEDGFVYTFAEDTSTDSGTDISAAHNTPVVDWGQPDKYKRWSGLNLVARGCGVNVRSRTDYFDTSDSGWTDATLSLDSTSEFREYSFYLNITSKQIQWQIANVDGGDLEVRAAEILEPLIEENR